MHDTLPRLLRMLVQIKHVNSYMSRDMWFPTMWYFDELPLSLETSNDVRSVALKS